MSGRHRNQKATIQVHLDPETAEAVAEYTEFHRLPSPSEAVRTLVLTALHANPADGEMMAALRRGANETKIRSINALYVFWTDYMKALFDQLKQIEYDAEMCPVCGERCANCSAKKAAKKANEGGGSTT